MASSDDSPRFGERHAIGHVFRSHYNARARDRDLRDLSAFTLLPPSLTFQVAEEIRSFLRGEFSTLGGPY